MINPIPQAHIDLQRARYAGLLTNRCDIYGADVDGKLPTTPTHPNVLCELEVINRLASPIQSAGNAGGVGSGADQIPVRFDIRFAVGTDVKSRDHVVVKAGPGAGPYNVIGVRNADAAVFTFADCERTE